ncbi:unnamed protein product [Calypogeia fissa]
MEILASSLPVGLSCHNSGAFSSSCSTFSSRTSASFFSSKTRYSTRVVCRKSDDLWTVESRHGGFSVPIAPGRNLFPGGWCRQIVTSASSGNNPGGKSRPNSAGSKGRGGKGKGNPPEKRGDGKKKENVWNADGVTVEKTSNSSPSKKPAKPNVWSADFSSGRSSPELKAEKEGRDGGRGTGGRARVNVIDEEGSDVRQESSNAVKSNGSTLERTKNDQQQLDDVDDVDDTLFLKYLSPLLPIEKEESLQPEEPVPNPLFSTFCSNSAGVWRGVGATFSPVTGDFEPICLDDNKQAVYDVRVLTTVENLRTSKDGAVLSPEQQSLHRKVLWALDDTLIEDEQSILAMEGGDDDSLSEESDIYEEVDELGYWEDDEDTEDDEENSDWEIVLADPVEIDERWEKTEEVEGSMKEIEDTVGSVKEDETDVLDWEWEGGNLPADSNLTTEEAIATTTLGPSYDEEFTEDPTWSDVMEEDLITWEPGLVFFEDGAYSRGPLELLTDASSSSRDNLNAYTCKVEQCLVAGGHKRLRIVHTVSIEEGDKIEVLRLAAYEEEWMGPCNMKSISDVGGHHLKLFSERPRHSPEDIVGSWKVFEVEGMALYPAKPDERASFAFYCKESSMKRGFPEMPQLSVEDNSVDLSDFSMSWLTGNVSTYVSLGDTGALTFGVGWVCDDGTRLVMERAYGEDGKLLRVKSKSEIRTRQ